jgi:hypothetical protein
VYTIYLLGLSQLKMGSSHLRRMTEHGALPPSPAQLPVFHFCLHVLRSQVPETYPLRQSPGFMHAFAALMSLQIFLQSLMYASRTGLGFFLVSSQHFSHADCSSVENEGDGSALELK